jgi:hypothetical protein
MTDSRIQELDSLGFVWDLYEAAWEESFSALAHYRKINGHCNVPSRYKLGTSVNLGTWVSFQRKQYRLKNEVKRSFMNDARIKKLEGIDFQWKLR